VWHYGGGDWTLPWRVYHGLDEQFRPVDKPDSPPHPITNVARYRRMIYGFAKASAVLEGRIKDDPGPPRPPRREPHSPGGVILPTGTGSPQR